MTQCGNPFHLGMQHNTFAVDACKGLGICNATTILLISGANDPVGLFGVGVQTCTNLETAGIAIYDFISNKTQILNEDKDTREQVTLIFLLEFLA